MSDVELGHWFTPVERGLHPCRLPDLKVDKDHRAGEYWRCDVCEELWVVKDYGVCDPTLSWGRVASRWLRRKLRKYGYKVRKQ